MFFERRRAPDRAPSAVSVVGVRGGGDARDAEPVEAMSRRLERPARECKFTKAADCEKPIEWDMRAEDGHVVRTRIEHCLHERGHVGDVVGVARRRASQ